MYEYAAIQQGDSNNSYWESTLNGSGNGAFILGSSTSFGSIDGAVRFPSIPLNQGQNVLSARLHMWISSSAGGGGTVRFTAYGIKETNTASFTSNPFGRTKTTSSYSDSKSSGTTSVYVDTDVTSLVNEITSQSGWTNGNAMGFLLFNNGSDASNGWFEDSYELKEVLTLQLSATPNLFPTPITLSAPTFPSSQDWGIRVSEPNVDVKTASESQLYFTTRKKELRVSSTGETTATTVAHGLSYAPAVLGYYTDTEGRHIINYGWNVFQVGAAISSDATNVYLEYENSSPEFYYVFIDPLT